ncbi:predicted protein [Naegleria gruberi]|uniref:Predicted protein n=1 Tax=Naegleria gruberi TaxID=5762 RepID=D2VUL2_NAEGR|nr:uncharacterized protein NAEGRDRAFT_52380 [Naegleria gruberi]EFC39471.1 predicted protein [Naegleria gruberi]|eukprot:XP_002672215.1 predicted protein [Naegleria gruberi strain NEG-M]
MPRIVDSHQILLSLILLALIFHIVTCSSSQRTQDHEVKRCINYSPIFFNTKNIDVAVASEENHYKILLPYLKQHGVNCIRLYFTDWRRYHADFFKVVNELHMKVMITFWQYTDSTPNLADSKERQKTHDDAVFLFKTISTEPSVFMIFYGNELDLIYPYQIPLVFVAFQEFIDLQRQVIPDPTKRKSLSLPLSDSGFNLKYVADYDWVQADYNTFNIYRGSTFLDFVESYKMVNPSKPLIIAETGASSYYQFPHQIPKPYYVYNASDPSIQLGERYQAMNHQRVLMEYIASSVVNPGLLDVLCLFEATDEYWKTSNDLNPYCQSRDGHLASRQNTCGYQNVNYKDKMIHEAFLGLMRQDYSKDEFSLIPKPSFNVMSFYYRSMENISQWSCEISQSGWNSDILNTRIVPDIVYNVPYETLRLFETVFQTKIGEKIFTCKFKGKMEILQALPLKMNLYNYHI